MKIEIIKPFNEAIELTKKILFQPFDLRKWCVIGFTAFLANLGGGFNFNPGGTKTERDDLGNLADQLSEIPPWILILGGAVIALSILALIVVLAWLRARGRFMFIDCVVKNRGAIAEPWREFKREANSFFLFSLLICLSLFGFVAILSLPFMLPIVRGVTFLASPRYLPYWYDYSLGGGFPSAHHCVGRDCSFHDHDHVLPPLPCA